jgi:hypothetical protein
MGDLCSVKQASGHDRAAVKRHSPHFPRAFVPLSRYVVGYDDSARKCDQRDEFKSKRFRKISRENPFPISV